MSVSPEGGLRLWGLRESEHVISPHARQRLGCPVTRRVARRRRTEDELAQVEALVSRATAFLEHVGLPLGECLRRIGTPAGCLLAAGRMWEGSRLVRTLALGARAVALGRAALIAVDEDPERGLCRLVSALALETAMLISALGKYAPSAVDRGDLWTPEPHPSAIPVAVDDLS